MRAWIDRLEARVLLSSASSQDQLFVGDFDGDGDQDLLDARQGSIWAMENGVRVEAVQLPEFAGINPLVRGVADVNGDGTDDIVTYKDGAVNAWIMSGARPVRQQLVGTSFGWRPAAFADVNGDGTDDIIWQNHSNGAIGAWQINDGVATGWLAIGQADLQQWQLVDAADLNGDGREDLLWATYPQGGGFAVGTWLMTAGAAEYRHLGVAGGDWQILGAEKWQDGAARILWAGPLAVGAWSITPDAVSYVHLGTTGITSDSPTSLVAGVADIDGNGRQDILFEARFQQAFGAWLIADSGTAAPYHEIASGVSSFYRYITTSAAGDPYVLSQSETPLSVAVNALYRFDRLVAEPMTGRVTTASQLERAPAAPGVFRVEGGVERIAYDPAAPSSVQILAVTGLEDRYDGGETLNLVVKARNHAFNPNTKLTVTFSTNDVLGDSDDVAAPAQDLAIDYGADREQTVTLTPPLLQGSYYVIVSVDGDAAGNQWVPPGPVEIMSNPPLQISTNYERGWYVESEPLIIDVTVRNDGVFPLPAKVPVEVEVLTYSPDNRLNWVLIGSDRQVYDEGLASDESRTFQLELVPRGLRIIARASWPGGSVEEYQETVAEVRPQERFVNRGDLDGDGDDDLIYPNAQGIEAWILENGQRLSTETITTNRAVTGVGDLDGDGIDEVLVFGASGTQALRLGAADPVAGVVPSDVPADRRAIAVGDVNGDGVDDIIWSSSADSVIRASLRSPDGYSWRDLGTHSGQGWSLQGLADLDADGDDDLLWYHSDASGMGAMGAWLVSADGPSQWLELPASRVPQHFGDFNGDGRTDLLSKQNGVFEVRLMNSDLTTSSHTIERGEEGWRLIAVAEVNSDGTDDLVWRSPDHWTVKAELMRDGVAYDWQTVFEPSLVVGP